MRARLTVLSTISSQLSTSASHCFFADLFRTNAHCVFHRKNEYFSIANLARLGCGDYHIDRPLHHVVCHHHFHFYFWQDIHCVLAPPVDFSVSFLPAKPFDFGDSRPFDAKLCQSLFDLFELEWFDDGFQFFHVRVNSASRVALQSKANRSTRSLSNVAMRMQSRIFFADRCGSACRLGLRFRPGTEHSASCMVACPFAGRGEGEGLFNKPCVACPTPHLNPLPLCKGRGEKGCGINTNFPSSIGWFRTDMPRKFAKKF